MDAVQFIFSFFPSALPPLVSLGSLRLRRKKENILVFFLFKKEEGGGKEVETKILNSIRRNGIPAFRKTCPRKRMKRNWIPIGDRFRLLQAIPVGAVPESPSKSGFQSQYSGSCCYRHPPSFHCLCALYLQRKHLRC